MIHTIRIDLIFELRPRKSMKLKVTWFSLTSRGLHKKAVGGGGGGSSLQLKFPFCYWEAAVKFSRAPPSLGRVLFLHPSDLLRQLVGI